MPKKALPNQLINLIVDRMAALEITGHELALRTGKVSGRTVDLLLAGTTFLPIDYAESFATALEVPVHTMVRLALLQFLDEAFVDRYIGHAERELVTLVAARTEIAATLGELGNVYKALDDIDAQVTIAREKVENVEVRLRSFAKAVDGDSAGISRPSA